MTVTIYRVLDDEFCEESVAPGQCREFLEIMDNPEASQFMAWHKDDVKKWADLLTEKCK